MSRKAAKSRKKQRTPDESAETPLIGVVTRRIGHVDEAGRFLMDAEGLLVAIGLRLPYGVGGVPLTEPDIADVLTLSTRQVRNLARRGLPRVRGAGASWRYPEVDCIHWKTAHDELYEQRRLGPRLSLREARDVVMQLCARCEPERIVRVPRSFANLAKTIAFSDANPFPDLDDNWPEVVSIDAQFAAYLGDYAGAELNRLG